MSNFMYRNSSKTYFFNTCFDKNQLKNLISWFIKQSGEKVTVDFLETLKQIGFHQATLAGVSLGLDDLQIPLQKSFLISQAKTDVTLFEQESYSGNLTSVEKSQRMISTWNQTSEILRKTAVQQFKSTNPVNPVYMMAFSGARGNISQVRQLVAMRGLMADPQGVILEFPIQSNFREGLTLTEYLISCFGARKGLVDTALRTATSGYLTRRLVDAAQHIIVSLKDCGTTQGFRLRNKELEHHLIGRVLAKDLVINKKFSLKRNQKISPILAKLIAKNVQEIFVRSPLTCKSENSICQLCYGWNLAHGNLVSLGEAVGVIAAQSIGEPGTQLTMRTFHTGGVGVFSDQAMKYFFSPYDGIVEYAEGLPGHFVRTPHGKIVYMIKNTSSISENIILKLRSFQTKQVQYFLKKQDLPPGSILLVKQGEHVKTGQVLAQSSHFKKSKQKMPESTHPVFSSLSGEVYLESMTILKQKQLSQKSKKTKNTRKKEIETGPEIRTLKGLGNFWVFSSQNQQEFHAAQSILRAGDLVSSKSLLFQYDFYIAKRSIFHSTFNKACVGIKSVDLSVEKINFHKVAYSLVVQNKSILNKKNQSNKKDILFFNQRRLQNFLIWFPTDSFRKASGYCFNFLLYSEKNQKHQLNIPHFALQSTKSLPNEWFDGSFFYLAKNINSIKTNYQDYFKTTQLSYFLNLKNSGYSLLQSEKQVKKYSLVQYSSNFSDFSTAIIQKSSKNKSLYKNATIKRKFLYSQQKNYLIDPTLFQKTTLFQKVKLYSKKTTFFLERNGTKSSNFLKTALKKVKQSCFGNRAFSKVAFDSCSLFVQEKKGWIFIPKNLKTIKNPESNTKLAIFEQGKRIDNFFFLNSKLCIQHIPSTKLGIINELKIKKISHNSTNKWYSSNFFLQQKSFLLKDSIKNNKKNHFTQSNVQNLLDLNIDPKMQSNSKKQSVFEMAMGQKNSMNISKNSFKSFLYYKIGKQANSANSDTKKFPQIFRYQISTLIKLKDTSEKTLKYFFFAYSLKEFSLPKKEIINKQWIGIKKSTTSYLTNSSVFTKQESTVFNKSEKLTKNFQLIISQSNGWFFSKNIYKILINLPSYFLFKHVHQNYFVSTILRNNKIPTLGFNVFLYNFLSLPENTSFYFEIFENNWVFPSYKLTTGFIKIQNSGEFRRFKSTNNNSIICVLTSQDLVTLDLSKFNDSVQKSFIFNKAKNEPIVNHFTPLNLNAKTSTFFSSNLKTLNKTKQLKLGEIVRSGTEVLPEIASSIGGLILNKKVNQVSIRLGLPFLASARGILHVFQNDLIQKNDLLVTLKSRRLQTEDIVQGIPKIEQLFEARETQAGSLIRNNVHTRLKKYFVSALKSENFSTNTIHTNLSQAVNVSLTKIQFFLVQSILQAYSSQGVKISQKHIEIIVRQMTTRVRIIDGGDSGLLPGELLQFTRIQKLNEQLFLLNKNPAIYEPIILGITKSVLQSESFLLSASFQEVSRVLVRSALMKKTDFLRGLHENVILGQLVPTGTGLIATAPKRLEK